MNRINLKLEINKFNAIVGATGSGKSTLTNLLMKFYEPNAGNILINNKNLNDIDASQFRNKIGYVGQEPILFQGTIRDNIQIGRKNASD